MKKKILSLLLCGGVLLGNALTVLADTGASVSMSWTVYSSGAGVVDGSSNGVYYSLTTGDVHLEATSVSGPGTKTVELRRKAGLISYGYGTNSITGTGNYPWTVTKDSDSYYLKGFGGDANSNQSISGKMHDH